MDEARTPAVSITSARAGRSVDLRNRRRRYLVSMLVRTMCFVAAVVTTGTVRWMFVAAAIFLPYIAVVLANNGSHKDPDDAEQVRIEPKGALTTKPTDDA